MKNNDLTYDKYGFSILSSSRKTKNLHLYISLYYVNNEKHEDYTLTFDFKKGNFLRNRARQKLVQNIYNKKNIAVGIAQEINNKYSNHHSSFPVSLSELINEIPNSLIKNNEALEELFAELNQHNKQLLAHVALLIKQKRNKLIEKEELAKSKDELSIKEFEKIKKELGL